jgi:hypothetical protein
LHEPVKVAALAGLEDDVRLENQGAGREARATHNPLAIFSMTIGKDEVRAAAMI